MKALVGQFMRLSGPTPAGGHWYRARQVDLEGQPTWMLGQLRSMWRKFRWDTDRLCTVLLANDWSLLANTGWPPALVDGGPPYWEYVNGVGRAYCAVPRPPLVGQMPASRPVDGQRWAYLWEHGGEAMHVYAAVYERWHHIATLPVDVLTQLTPQLVIDVQVRAGWVQDAA